jgi:hypothetical protein
MHLSRFRKHGVVEHERFDKWGHADKHPLAHVYYHMRRTHRGAVCQSWLDNFWQFVKDVGDRPSAKHKFKRIDMSKPYCRDNVQWEPPILNISVTTREGANAYARAYRANNPNIYRDQHLTKKYGRSLDWFNETLQSQGGGCAICGGQEVATDRITGLPRNLAVDHCHATGKMRGLLCTACNTALGGFKDDPALLTAAIAYLAAHACENPS